MLSRAPDTNGRPFISVVIVVYDMNREAPRTLHTLSAAYQRGIEADQYEVLVVDNGSPEPLGEAVVRGCGPNFRYHYIDQASPSPVAAINTGVAMTRGEVVAVMIDGARMVTPGLLDYGRRAFALYADPVVTCPPGIWGRNRSNCRSARAMTRNAKMLCWPGSTGAAMAIDCLKSGHPPDPPKTAVSCP